MKQHVNYNKTKINKKYYSQYYTSEKLGDFLVNSIPDCVIQNILDLSAGEGALLISAKKRYKSASLFGIDIDPVNVAKMKLIENMQCYCLDSTEERTLLEIKKIKTMFELVVGNPPFGKGLHSNFTRKYFQKWKLNNDSKYYRLEVLFLIISLELVGNKGCCGIIVPDGILSSEKYSSFREILSQTFKYIHAIELDERSFVGTEARTHILILSNESNATKEIICSSINHKDLKININKSQFITRGDNRFNSFIFNKGRVTLESENIKIQRGRVIKERGKDIIHTSSFDESFTIFSNDNEIKVPLPGVYAVKGDVILPRVGSRSLGKVGVVISGFFLITDCVFVIKASESEYANQIINIFKSDFGIQWIKSISKGVGAQYITINDLKKLPLSE